MYIIILHFTYPVYVDTTFEEQQQQYQHLQSLNKARSNSSPSKPASQPSKPTTTPASASQTSILDAGTAAPTQGIFKKFNFPPIDRDIAQLSPALLSSVNATLFALPNDLEVAARAATVVCL